MLLYEAGFDFADAVESLYALNVFILATKRTL